MKKGLVFSIFALLFSTIFAQNGSDSLHIVHYNIHLDATDFTNRTIVGYAELTAVPKLNLTQFSLDLQGPTADSIFINGESVNFTHTGNKIHIAYSTSAGDTLLARIYYHGHPAQDARWGGFYYSGEYCYNMGVAFDYQPHNFGRCWFPCLDVFTDKSSYTMHIRTQAGKRAICGGDLVDSLTLDDSTRIWTWQLEDVIPTYLASIAVGPYQLYADTFHGAERIIPIHIYAQPSTISQVAGSFIHLKEVLRMYEQFFGPYRWSRVGYVAVNFASGAMEHATNIAYPNDAINGNTAYQTLYTHELFHHWFGDLITCNRAEEMWVNEGFATYSEALVSGLLETNPEINGYLDYIRDMHFTTLKDIVKDDGGHFALDNVPQSVTYGTHSYQKGALIIHTLRNYMGDSLFFSSLRSLLDHYAWQTVSSEQLFNYLSQVSGINLTDFYEGWVHEPGFPHFSIDSIVSLQNDNYRVYLRQKRLGGGSLVNSNKLDLTFVSEQRGLFTVEGVSFSGEHGHADVHIPFYPQFGIVDYYEKITDAVIDHTAKLVSGNTASYSDAYFAALLESFPDTLLLRVEHNMVTPDMPSSLPEGIVRISDNHYWTVNMAYNQMVNTIPTGYLQFKYLSGAASSPDHDLMNGYNKENLKLLYRATTDSPWEIISATQSGSIHSGSLKTTQMRPGQYCLAVGDVTANIENQESVIGVLIQPNPADSQLNVQVSGISGKAHGEIYDTTGKKVQSTNLRNGDNEINISALPAGYYLLRIKDSKNKGIVKSFIKKISR